MHAFASGHDIDDCDDPETLQREKRLSSSSPTNTNSSGTVTELLVSSTTECGDNNASTKAIQTLAKQIEVSYSILIIIINNKFYLRIPENFIAIN